VGRFIAQQLLIWSADTGIPTDAARIRAHDVMVDLVRWLAFTLAGMPFAPK
jgi:hypothetical protein